MKKKLAEIDGTTILVGWEHVNIQWLAQALAWPHDIQHQVDDEASCDSPPCPDDDNGKAWPDDNYDMIYKFTYDCGPSGCTAKLKLDDAVSLTELSQEFTWCVETRGPPPRPACECRVHVVCMCAPMRALLPACGAGSARLLVAASPIPQATSPTSAMTRRRSSMGLISRASGRITARLAATRRPPTSAARGTPPP